jgi:hypothetical protein
MYNKRLLWTVLLLVLAGGLVVLAACTPGSNRVNAQEAQPVGYETASLGYPPTLARDVTTAIIPASSGDPDGPGWDINAAYLQFLFTGYKPELGYFQAAVQPMPQVAIYNAQEYARLSWVAAMEIDRLKTLLAERPSPINDAIPFLPLLNAAQDLQAQVVYLDFDGGSGVRFITHYGQEPRPYVNDEQLYTFQGLSADGRYYVSVTFPIHAASLPGSFADSPAADDYETFSRNLAIYQAETTAALNQAAPSDFTPALALLDGIVQSLIIGDGLVLPETAAASSSDEATSGSLVPIEVAHVQVEVGIGSPIPIYVQVAGTWPGLCAQLAAVEQQVSDFHFDISLLAHPGDPDCPPDHMGVPFGLALPINVVGLPQGSYTVTVTVNGRSASFDVPLTPTMP